MVDTLIELLESFGYPVYRQGSLTKDDPYPETFITYWNVESPDHAHYDNSDFGTAWGFMLFVYSSDPDLTYSIIEDIRSLLQSNDWVVVGRGYDAASDEITHTGRAIDVYFLEI